MALALTAVFKKVPEGYIGFVEELPGANTQGATLLLETNRALVRDEVGERGVIREQRKIAG